MFKYINVKDLVTFGIANGLKNIVSKKPKGFDEDESEHLINSPIL